MFKLITREQAQGRGRKTYFTGEACLRQHIAERYTTNGVCIECKKLEAKTNRLKREGKICDAIREQVNRKRNSYGN